MERKNDDAMKIFTAILVAALLTSCASASVDEASTPGSELGFSLNIFKAVVAETKADSNVTVSPGKILMKFVRSFPLM